MVNEDDELLAELRAISSKSSSADICFGSSKDNEVDQNKNETANALCDNVVKDPRE